MSESQIPVLSSEEYLNHLQFDPAFSESEFLLRKVTENEVLGLAWASSDGKLIRANDTFYKLLGYAPGELEGRYFGEFTDPRDIESEMRLIEEINSGKRDKYLIEKRYVTKSGESTWVELNLSAYRNPITKKLELVVGIVQNINQRKIAEDELRLSEQKYKLLFDNNPMPMWIVELPDLTFIDANEVATNQYGYSKDEFLSLTAKQICADETLPPFLSNIGNHDVKPTLEGACRHVKKDGSIIHVEIFGQTIYYEGKLALLILAHDVSDKYFVEEKLKATTEQLQNIYDTLENSFWGMDIANGKMLYVSPGSEKIYGYSEKSFLDNPTLWWELILDEDKKNIEAVYPSLAEGNPVTVEFRIQHSDSSVRWLESRATPVLDEDDKLVRVDGILIDISGRKYAEEAIRISEARLNEAQRLTKTGGWEIDFVNNIAHWSDEVHRIFETDKETFVPSYEGFLARLEPEDQAIVENAFLKSLREKTPYEVVHRLVFSDGRIKYLNEKCETIYNEKGEPFRSVGTVQDITERKLAETELHERKESYRRVVENISDAIMIDDLSGRVRYANDRFLELFGLEKSDLDNLILEDYVAPEYREASRDRHNRRVNGENVPAFFEYEGIKKDGTRRWLEVRVSIVFDEGKIQGTQSAIRDITERKEADILLQNKEKQIREISSSIPGVVFQYKVDSNGMPGFTFVGDNVKELIGITADQLYDGMRILIESVVPEDIPVVKKEMEDNVASPGKFFCQFRMIDQTTKELKWVSVTAISSLLKDDTFIMNGTLTDVTERKKSEENLNKSYEELRHLTSHLQTVREEERSIIAREIHDELGQQLTGLKMDVAWIFKKINSQDPAVIDKINGMIGLIDDTMKTVRHISSKLRPVILDDLGLIDALDWQSNEFEKRTGIRCKFKSTLEETLFEKSLSTGIFRVYQETLTNVARHANASAIRTTFELSGESILLKVQDNGVGFDEKEIKSKNTLGLIGMKERATMFGGKVLIESTKGKGTVVTLEVPYKIVAGKSLEK